MLEKVISGGQVSDAEADRLKAEIRALVRSLKRQEEKWKAIERRHCDAAKAAPAQVKRLMRGHPHWDDPPEGATEEDLVLWSRGYLWGEGTHLGNAAETVWGIRMRLETLVGDVPQHDLDIMIRLRGALVEAYQAEKEKPGFDEGTWAEVDRAVWTALEKTRKRET